MTSAPERVAAANDLFFKQALDAIANGAATMPCFQQAGVAGLAALLNSHPAISNPDAAADQFEEGLSTLSERLRAASLGSAAEWPDGERGKRYLRAIIANARLLLPKAIETAADIIAESLCPKIPASTGGGGIGGGGGGGAAAATGTGGDGGGDAKATKAELHTIGKQLYGESWLVWPGLTETDADKQVKFEQVGKLARANKRGEPVIIPLNEYQPELKVTSGKQEAYEAFGQKWVMEESSHSAVTIKDDVSLFAMMARRAECKAVAGTFDVPGHRDAEGLPALEGPQACDLSKVQYIRAGKVATMAAFASPAVLRKEIEAMRAFRTRNPHVPTAQLVGVIDAGVQRRIANLKNQGYTEDAAVVEACVKSPELYSAALCEGAPATTTTGARSDGDGDGVTTSTRDGKRKQRSTEEQEATFQKRLEQKDRQIANLKGGKNQPRGPPRGGFGGGGFGGGGYGGGGGSGGGGYGNNGYGGGGGGGGSQGQFAGQPRPPPGNGPACPAGVCKDFNFKGAGCTRGTACTYKHVCALCGANHPWKGNH